MNRKLLGLCALAALLACVPFESTNAAGAAHGHGRGGQIGHGGGHGFGQGRGIGGGIIGFGGYGDGYGWDVAELYRELYNNLPYFALHPPVYYSEPVPRAYGWSPFAYPPGTMTPEIACESQPVTINNPYVPATAPAKVSQQPNDRSASAAATAPEPLVIVNPFVTPASSVAKGG